MLKYKIFTFIIAAVGASLLLPSCEDKNNPGWVYMPDMYDSPSIKAYEADGLFPDSLSAREPVQGTVPRGFRTYGSYPATPQGYEDARANLKMPSDIPTDSAAMFEAGKLYGIYCDHCHGDKGDGQGILVKNGKFLGVPSYADRQINEGTIFHVITYGRGVMGSHASQVTPTERWLLAQHVLKLKRELAGGGEEASDKAAEDTSAKSDSAAAKDGAEQQKKSDNKTETTEG